MQRVAEQRVPLRLDLRRSVCQLYGNQEMNKNKNTIFERSFSALGVSSTVEYGKHNQKAPEDVAFIREKTYTLPITLARGLRIRARTKKRKKRRTEKPGGVPTHSRRSFPFQGTLGPQANCRSGPKKKSRHHEVDVSSGTQLFSRSTWEAGLEERDQERHH